MSKGPRLDAEVSFVELIRMRADRHTLRDTFWCGMRMDSKGRITILQSVNDCTLKVTTDRLESFGLWPDIDYHVSMNAGSERQHLLWVSRSGVRKLLEEGVALTWQKHEWQKVESHLGR